MNLLLTERDTLDGYIPGLDKYLSDSPLLELEKPGNGALQIFRELGGPALLVPAEYEGKGASMLDAVRIQRAVGSRSPSLAVATTMHHFSVASLAELAAAESDQVTLAEVFVPEALIFYPQDSEVMDPIQARGFVWFELLISASYLGAATNLAERAIARGRGSDEDRAGMAIELEAVAAALEQVASVAATVDDNDVLLARALYARFATERAIERVVMSASAALGGMSFIESPEIAYLLGATRALAFHPPSRAAAAGPIARYLADGQLTL